jgi:hypothetical protein
MQSLSVFSQVPSVPWSCPPFDRSMSLVLVHFSSTEAVEPPILCVQSSPRISVPPYLPTIPRPFDGDSLMSSPFMWFNFKPFENSRSKVGSSFTNGKMPWPRVRSCLSLLHIKALQSSARRLFGERRQLYILFIPHARIARKDDTVFELVGEDWSIS